MIDRYDCIIHNQIPNVIELIGPVVKLKLHGFHEDNHFDHLPYYVYEIQKGDLHVGMISLRIGFNDATMVNGHIGYEIDEPHRGHYYSYYALELIKNLAMDHGYRYLLVSTSVDNIASQKIIRRAKGNLILADLDVPKDHIYYVLGKTSVHIYEIRLG
ncbi:MAG: GNAT family N-acetyltransferase [Acholeplasmataceae bacterium]|nr:GNAT family N-acetyltransferase [Acholeplasmataceae bacterium]